MIRIFRDKRAIESLADQRLEELRTVFRWFKEWEAEAAITKEADKLSTKPMLPSQQCMEDMKSMLFTFEDVCKVHLNDFPDGSIVPARFNSDPVENHFCQIRGVKNGNNTNPTVL